MLLLFGCADACSAAAMHDLPVSLTCLTLASWSRRWVARWMLPDCINWESKVANGERNKS